METSTAVDGEDQTLEIASQIETDPMDIDTGSLVVFSPALEKEQQGDEVQILGAKPAQAADPEKFSSEALMMDMMTIMAQRTMDPAQRAAMRVLKEKLALHNVPILQQQTQVAQFILKQRQDEKKRKRVLEERQQPQEQPPPKKTLGAYHPVNIITPCSPQIVTLLKKKSELKKLSKKRIETVYKKRRASLISRDQQDMALRGTLGIFLCSPPFSLFCSLSFLVLFLHL